MYFFLFDATDLTLQLLSLDNSATMLKNKIHEIIKKKTN